MGGWFVARRATMGGWFRKKIGAEGADFFAPQAQRRRSRPKKGPPLGEKFFFGKNFYKRKIF